MPVRHFIDTQDFSRAELLQTCRRIALDLRDAFELVDVGRHQRLVFFMQNAEQLLGSAMCEGMRSLRQDGIEKVLQGITSMSEVRDTSNV